MRSLPLFFLILFLTLPASGQLQQGGEDVRVGLVLSGGGAKGMAHIGALKVIEEAGVRIDYIGGTSMGAIVGALYASGYSAAQLDSLFRATDFTELIQDNLPRSAKTFYEKEDSERYAITLPFNRFRISFPQAISGGQNIYNELVRALYHVKDISDFNQLPIPFFCMATDVETGEEIRLDHGYLPEAIMASGTFPSLFEPSEIEGRILIDGGVLNNYPVDEVRNMGAELVIGVDVQHGLRSREALLSATEILLQINNYRTVGQMQQKSARTDVYIKPDMDPYSVIDFDQRDSIIREGTRAAKARWGDLLRVAARQQRKPVARPRIRVVDSITVNRLLIAGNNGYSRGYVKGKLRFDLAEPIPFGRLRQGISNLAATGNFRTIRYELLSNGLGEDLILKLREDPNRTFIRIGAHYDDLYKSGALINLTQKHLLSDDDVGSLDLILGDHIRYNLQYYMDKGSYWSFGFNSRFNSFGYDVDYATLASNFTVPADPNINILNLDVSDLTNQLYVQTVLNEEFAFSLGAEHKLLQYSTETLSPPAGTDLPAGSNYRTYFENSYYLSAYGTLTLDTYDDRYLPQRGLYFDGDFHLYLLSSDFNDNFREFAIGKARMGTAFALGRNLSLNLETEGGFKLGTSTVTALDFVLGGYGARQINNFTPFLGYDYLSLPGNSYVKAFARMDWEFAPKSHMLVAANYANVADDLFRTGEWFTAPDFSGYGLGYAWESFFGPLQVLYSWSPEGGSGRFFFSLGYWF
ncbi:patatin-like phospholipase family protein [Robiginitalea sp. M366]|uniref:patatin-like phospholipase family protein n=1 Tax=Robiginitalea aestuariiviva TaxID=3036903 RepID=UPI00240E0978|nr:patatin-like phospholipase family protein [Robiginitalea aestuariiviva]MDG1571666.1 patatin-like phospholipase family protein [Robiginitalea aestuariiviva]